MKKIGVLGIMISLFVIGLYFLQKQPSDIQAQEEAILQAKDYHPNGICTDALVPAVHKSTGAKYTFSNGCLPPGWEPER